jgi:hypothetical protein
MARARPNLLEAAPHREVLETLARHYDHLQNEHKRAGLESGVRRRIEDELLRVRERFDRLLDEWVPEDDLRNAWREHLHHRAPEPPGPPAVRPLLFRGRSDAAGTEVEVRGERGDELEVTIDGALLERVAAVKDLSSTLPTFTFRLDGTEFHETFTTSPEAVDALVEFLHEGGSPPWEHALELLADGLIDRHVALMPRGRRALARARVH